MIDHLPRHFRGADAEANAMARAGEPVRHIRRSPIVASARTAAIGCLALALAIVSPALSHAQTVRPWLPPDADSLTIWTADAKAAFQLNKGDSTGGTNYRAYELVGRMGRRLMRSLGRTNLLQAPAVESLLDSLGFDTDVRVEPRHPFFALLMVRDPYHRNAKAVGFLCWYKETDFRTQAIEFNGGLDPAMTVWWSGREEAPWEWGIVEQTRAERRASFTLLQLAPNGTFWQVVQYDPEGLDLAGVSSMEWADINGDEKPELVAWAPASHDSLFDLEGCRDCPRMFNQLTFVERPRGFALMDTRIVPAPLTTFMRFARLLADGDRDGASRLLSDPHKLDQAIAAGWASGKRNGTWRVLYTEPNTAWPQWLMVRHHGSPKVHDYKVDLEPVRGRWLIHGWELRDDATTPGYLKPDSLGHAKPSGGKTKSETKK